MTADQMPSALAASNTLLRRRLFASNAECRRLEQARDDAKLAAEVNGATIAAMQAEVSKARRHIAHALVCRVRLAGGCHPCRIAETWRTT